MKERLRPYTKDQTDQLITTILRRSPQFIQWLGNKKPIEDVHFLIRKYEHKIDYTWYRFQRSMCRRAGVTRSLQPDGVEPYSASEYLEMEDRPTQAELYHATLVGMLCAMGDVFAAVCTLYHLGDGQYHDCGQLNQVDRRLHSVAREKLISAGTNFDTQALSNDVNMLYEHQYEKKIDLHPFLVFVFQYLRDEGFDWEYRSDYLSDTKRIENGDFGPPRKDEDEDEDVNEDWLELEDPDDDELMPDAEQYTERSLADLSFESEYLKFVEEEPEPAVRAYIEVYGVEPDGYPPRMDHY